MEDTASTRQRLFVAVPLPDELCSFIQAAQGALPPLSGLRFMSREQFHVTLAFIGEVGEDKAEAARAVVRRVPEDLGGEAVIGGFLHLPSAKRARVVALRIEDEGSVFADLFLHVMAELETAGVMEREKRPFRPHLTVARLRVPGPVQPRAESGEVRFAVESVCLFESKLKREGAVYTVLERAALAQKDEEEPG